MQPDMMQLHAVLVEGAALQKRGSLDEADQRYRSVLAQVPHHPLALHLAATVAAARKQYVEAIKLYQSSLKTNSSDHVAWSGLAQACLEMDQVTEAQAAARKSIELAPQVAKGWYLDGLAASLTKDYAQASASMAKARSLGADSDLGASILGTEWDIAQKTCDWAELERGEQLMRSHGGGVMTPFSGLAFADDPVLHRRCAQAAILRYQRLDAVQTYHRHKHTKIRVAYLSSDFHEHATAYLMAELFERHDRSRFEVIGVSWGPNDASPIRQRLERSFDEFWDVRDCTAVQISQRMVQGEIDIAVDLKGYTFFSRPDIFLHKPAPIVVNYLGYPGSMGSQAYDYIIGDAIVTPFEHAEYYSEHIVQMPNSYQVNDSKRTIALQVPSREQEGLPEKGFVFAAFNNVYKIRPAFFKMWMNLLRQVPGSVLWLVCPEAIAQNNLRAEAVACGIDPNRLVFARKAPLAQHLARHVHAGVLLDNLPVNAHTTASDALWAGIPVITCMGQAFAGRVAASLLTAVGLQELITHSLQDYEALALRIAQDSAYQQHLCDHLKAVRHSTSLFDAGRFAADIEAAYTHMYERWQQGLPPKAFAVANIEKTSQP